MPLLLLLLMLFVGLLSYDITQLSKKVNALEKRVEARAAQQLEREAGGNQAGTQR